MSVHYVITELLNPARETTALPLLHVRCAASKRPAQADMWIQILLCCVLLTGCATPDWNGAQLPDWYDRVVARSVSYERALAIDVSRAIWFVDSPGERPTIYVGFDMGTHTCRSAT